MGFNACVITDHNTLKNSDDIAEMALKYQNEIVVIQGMEYTTSRIHMNFIGIYSWNLRVPIVPTDQEILEAIEEVHQQGGVVSVNHYIRTESKDRDDFPSRELLIQ
jgi:predicted metal-dependent phosphoesterase TrpH